MHLAADLSSHTGKRLAEVGFLLILIAGGWLATPHVPRFKFWRAQRPARTIVAGVLLAIAGLLLIIATHWGHFG